MNPEFSFRRLPSAAALWLLLFTAAAPGLTPVAEDETGNMADIAKKLNNPVASLINLPFQSNFDFGGGPGDDGFQYKLNFQPVVPIRLNDDWKIISRTIIPYIYQEDRIGESSQSGLGDITASLFFSPENENEGAPVWGVGPVFLFPSASDDLLGTEKWGLGPTVLLLKQSKGWTAGLLASQLWSFAGEEERDDVSLTSIQPFLNYTTPSHTSFGLNLESTYDWTPEEWTVPVNLMVSQLVRFGKLPVNFQLGGRYYLDKPDGGPDWGLRFAVTFVIPE
ncbi:MAG: transporter [Verrucomicrobiota bacterium]